MLDNLQQIFLKLLQKKKKIEKTAEETKDLIDNKVTDKNTTFSKNKQQNNSEADTNEHEYLKNLKKDKYLRKTDKKLLMI